MANPYLASTSSESDGSAQGRSSFQNQTLPRPDGASACVMVFNAIDPSGAAGLSADVTTLGSLGCHALPVVVGAYARDTAHVFDFFCFDEEAVAEQARAALEDMPALAFKVGFLGSPEVVSAVAEIASDYAEVPLVAYMPDLSWWQDSLIESYLDAFEELLLPQATVLVGNHSTLWRWLLPDWSGQRKPGPRDIAKAASEWGVSYVLVTGIAHPQQYVENTLVTEHSVLYAETIDRFEGQFVGAGDTLSATLTALIAGGVDLVAACVETFAYLDRCLEAGFRPGMGHFVPDRMFWAAPDANEGPASMDAVSSD